MTQQGLQLAQQLGDIKGFWPCDLLPAQRCKPGRQPHRALSDVAHLLKRFTAPGIVLILGEQDLDIAQDDLQQVVEVVRDAAGHLAHCAHLLGMGDPFFQALDFRHVATDRGDP